MDDETSARFALPLLAAGQAQKEMTVNEALTRLDMAVQASAVAGGVDTPPEAPAAGQCWIVGDAPSGAWSAAAGMFAAWTAGGWRFVNPVEGMTVWVEEDGVAWHHAGGAWRRGEIVGDQIMIGGVQVVGPQQAAIPSAAAGTTIDAEARATIDAILETLRTHGLIAR